MSQILTMPYGAFELKRRYQANMLCGMAVAIVLVFVPLALMWLFLSQSIDIPMESPPQPVDSVRIFIPRSIIVDPGEPAIGSGAKKQADNAIGIPVPVPDDTMDNDTSSLNTIDYLKRLNGPVGNGDEGSTENGTSGNGVYKPMDTTESIPPSDTFIPVELLPEPINTVEPDYPRLALEGGFTAKLWVEAFVDKSGIVKRIMVVSCSRPGLGFEEAAIAAGYKIRYRPAIQNSNPVGVWVTYQVVFSLKDR